MTTHQAIIAAAFGAWIPATAALSRLLGPRVAVPASLLAGFLLLPRGSCEGIVPVVGPWITKATVSGPALLVGILASDPRTLLKGRPSWLDAPMAAFVLMPLASLAANGLQGAAESLGQAWTRLAALALPYLAGRLYFGDAGGPARLVKAVVIAGLASLPIVAFEMAAGPRYYLAGLVYGIGPYDNMVSRLGGWRPEGFQNSGIEVAAWLALAASLSGWCWVRGGWPSRPSVAWIPPAALALGTLACRGVYGYLDLAVGLAAAFVTHAARTRAVLVALALLPPAYVLARGSGAWDGQGLATLARPTGRAGTVEYRLRAEDAYLAKVAGHGPILGFGGVDSGIFDWHAGRHLWPDGWWVHQLRSGGGLGLAVSMLALFLVPAGLALALPGGRDGGPSPASMAWGLALFLLLHQLDSLQNMDDLMPTPLLGGSLVGLFAARRSISRTSAPAQAPGTRGGSRVPLAVALIVLACVEALGRRPRAPALPSGPEAPPAVQRP